METDFDVPRTIAICPCCGGALYLEVSEWIAETGEPTETGCYVDCNEHCELDYGTGLVLTNSVYLWAREHIRVTESLEETREKLRQWEAGEPIKAAH